MVEASMVAFSIDNNVLATIYEDLKDGAASFTVAVDGTVRLEPWFIEGHRHHMSVSCVNVTLGRGGSNVGPGGSGDPPGEVINYIYVDICHKLVCGSVVWQQCKEW
ncbi:hypothetical protein RHMOL_Rhmol13G0275900 [Rhododendron molle]|uniref:Uncharacterized protein n=1 Tax=Rhododendron molle TaxID=49168 RepID=A0ACC0LBC9_RHOML|nr:hypothetical protein RHMOL_Rhmol13G0275900 [Rhododendron molle]